MIDNSISDGLVFYCFHIPTTQVGGQEISDYRYALFDLKRDDVGTFKKFHIFFVVTIQNPAGLGGIFVNNRKLRNQEKNSLPLSSQILRQRKRKSECDVYVYICMNCLVFEEL